jgi:hypothetical protein
MRSPVGSLLSSSIAVLAVAATAAAALPAVASADVRMAPCPRVGGELVRVFNGDVYVRDGALWGCTAQYALQPVTRRLGPWGKGSTAVFDGRYATWTTRSGSRATTRDRVSSVDVGTGAVRFRDVAPVPGSSADDRIVGLKAYSLAAAWVTVRGTLVLSVQEPLRAPKEIGAGSAAGGGLVLPLRPTGDGRLVVGRWLGQADAVARSFAMDALGGAGSPCGGRSTPLTTVKPLADGPRVGASWDVSVRNSPDIPGC